MDRDEILLRYLKSPGVPLQGYKKAMEGGDMREKFTGEISMSANTWQTLILERYFEKLPAEQESIKKELLILEAERGKETARNELVQFQIPTIQAEMKRLKEDLERA